MHSNYCRFLLALNKQYLSLYFEKIVTYGSVYNTFPMLFHKNISAKIYYIINGKDLVKYDNQNNYNTVN